MDEESKEDLNPDLVEYLAGNIALYTIAQKYFAIICGGIFAIILAKPEIPAMIKIGNYSLGNAIGYYLIIGVIGLFHGELWKACGKVIKHDVPIPEFFKRAFILFVMIGMLIFGSLLTTLLNEGAKVANSSQIEPNTAVQETSLRAAPNLLR